MILLLVFRPHFVQYLWVVQALGTDPDAASWGARQLERNGSKTRIAIAPMTMTAVKYRNESKRGRSLQYSGIAPSDEAGLKADMKSLDFDAETVGRFIVAAKPFWPK